MEELKKRIHDDSNGLDYVLVGDYYIPDLKLPEESRPIGRWGRMHKAFLQEHRPGQYNELLLSGKLWTYLADLNEQADDRLACIISQMQAMYKQQRIPGSEELLKETKRVLTDNYMFEETVLPTLPCSNDGLYAMNQHYSTSLESLNIMLEQMEKMETNKKVNQK